MPDIDNDPESIRALVQQLAHRHLLGSYAAQAETHRQLIVLGAQTIPFVTEELDRIDFTTVDRSETTRLAVGLLTLLHDLDEGASRPYLEKVRAQSHSPVLRSALKSLMRFRLSDFRQSQTKDIAVLVHSSVPQYLRVTSLVDKWLNRIPEQDRIDLLRVFVVPHRRGDEQAGSYHPYLYVVTLNWLTGALWSTLFFWLANLLHEYTLYHELGHHMHRHEFGQDPEQEKQANDYADRLFRAAHPILLAALDPLVQILRLVVRRVAVSR